MLSFISGMGFMFLAQWAWKNRAEIKAWIDTYISSRIG